jgi:hypothetical protein
MQKILQKSDLIAKKAETSAGWLVTSQLGQSN